MRLLLMLRQRLRAIFRRRAADDELDRELRLHLDLLTREHVAAGLSEADARRAAMREFGPVDVTRERCRDTRRVHLVEDFLADLAYAWRVLVRSPGFAVAAVLSLALGIGANTAIFSLVHAVLLRQLPVDRPRDLVFLEVRGSEGGGGAPPYPCFERIRDETTSFAGMAAFATDDLRVEIDGVPEQVSGQVVSGRYFEILGVRPALGRLMAGEDERLDAAVAVISHAFWQRRFGGTADAIGRTLAFRDRAYTIVGVTPPDFHGLQPGRRVDVTLPITLERELLTNADVWWFEAVARLRPGVAAGRAAAEADTVFQSFMRGHAGPADMRRTHFDRLALSPAARGLDRLRTRFSTPLYALVAVAAVVLLIACVNLANLLLARGTARAREFAIRLATGAGAGRLVRQLLTETLLLFLLGAAAGVPIAIAAIDGLAGFLAVGRNPVAIDVPFDWRVLAFAGSLALAAGLLTGLWPAARAVRTDPHAAMKDGDGRVPGSRRAARAARGLVAAQVALSLVLLVVAAGFVRTSANLRAVDPGFDGRRVLTMSLTPPPGEATAEARDRYWRQVLERVRALPGVRAASLSVLTPLSGRDRGRRVTVPGFQPRSESERSTHLNHVSDDYFRTFDITLRAGRTFTPEDRRDALPVAAINEAAAAAYFGGRDPVGRTIALGDDTRVIVGVVRDHKHRSLREPVPRFVFVPLWQPVDSPSRVTLSLSSGAAPASLARAAAAEARAVHAGTLVSDVLTVEEQIDATLVSERLLSVLAAAFGTLALVLVAVGLYGVLGYAIARRRAEVGVRLALGATPGRIAGGLFRDVLLQVAAGLAAGAPPAILAARLAEGMLFGVSPADPATWLFSAATLAAVACAAAALPARRVWSIDPSDVLRAE